jgi:ethanolamine-phosphate cytidylyltransferase
MAPKIDPEAGCIIPDKGHWPVDPQEDQEIREDRLWIDGCFDFFHHGHTGVMLQSRRLGNELLVGLHSDKDIAANKGPTVMNLDERTAAVEACRFSTRVVPHAPYVTSIPWISHYGCQYVTHGDDITSDAGGQDCYRFVKKAGRMKIVPRTHGISTTDLVGRMLLCTKGHFIKNLDDVLEGKEGRGSEEERKLRGRELKKRIAEYAAAPNGKDRYVQVFDFVPKHRPLERRMSNLKPGEDVNTILHHDHGKGTFTPMVSGHAPRPGQRVVYVDGGFDLFSSGHIAFLETVSELERKLGEERGWFTPEAKESRERGHGEDYGPAYVVAGVHTDEVINYHKGINYPIMNLVERGLCVVQCRYIHAVIFSAPHKPSKSYLHSLPCGTPNVVYHGPTHTAMTPPSSSPANMDPYHDAKALGLFQETPKHRFQDVNADQIVHRILENRHEYEERQRKKGEKVVGEEAQHRREQMEREAEKERERRARSVERKFSV